MAAADDESMAVIQQPEELEVIYKVLDSFYQYRRLSHLNITHRRRQNFYALPPVHQQILAGPPFNIQARLDAVDDAINANAEIAERVLHYALEFFDFEGRHGIDGSEVWQNTTDASNLTKASTTINQLYRDWSSEGAVERELHYAPVLQDLQTVFAGFANKSGLKVLVPGAGLGRLLMEICRLGFDVVGNEISYHALITGNWIMNALEPYTCFDLYPFASRFSNQLSFAEQIRKVKIPDVDMGTELERVTQVPRGTLHMNGSDFLTAYRQPEEMDLHDAVVTVFFIDTAPNLLRYIETISYTLKSGGHWINLGPLLWHFEDRTPPPTSDVGDRVMDSLDNDVRGIEEPGAVELTRDDVVHLVMRMGFEITFMECREGPLVGYIEQTTSMLRNLYKVFHFIARKK